MKCVKDFLNDFTSLQARNAAYSKHEHLQGGGEGGRGPLPLWDVVDTEPKRRIVRLKCTNRSVDLGRVLLEVRVSSSYPDGPSVYSCRLPDYYALPKGDAASGEDDNEDTDMYNPDAPLPMALQGKVVMALRQLWKYAADELLPKEAFEGGNMVIAADEAAPQQQILQTSSPAKRPAVVEVAKTAPQRRSARDGIDIPLAAPSANTMLTYDHGDGRSYYGSAEDTSSSYISPILSQKAAQMQSLCAALGSTNAAFIRHDTRKEVFVVDIGAKLDFMPSLRCRALGLYKGHTLVVRLLFPAKGPSATTVWTGHDAVRVEKVFTCPHDMFGLADADGTAAALATTAGSPTSPKGGGSSGSQAPPRTSTAPVPWYMRARVQEGLAKNQLALQELEVAQLQRDLAEVGNTSSVTTTSGGSARKPLRPPVVGAAKTSVIFGVPEERFYDTPNVLKSIHTYMLYRLTHCTAVCLICDDPLGYAGSKVGICAKPLCQHTAVHLGISADVVKELANNPIVCELLINLTRCAATVGDVRDTFEPMCPVNIANAMVGGRDGSVGSASSALNSTSSAAAASLTPAAATGPTHFYTGAYGISPKNFALLAETIDRIPSVKAMLAAVGLGGGEGGAGAAPSVGATNSALREHLNAHCGPLAYPLLQWIIASNHAHIELVPPEQRIIQMVTEMQFYLVSNNPQKERQFREAKRRAQQTNADGVGSFFAWHGSNAGNWHAILRQGLRNYSGTRFMSTGQMYGAGVYFAKDLGTAVKYVGNPQQGWANSETMAWATGEMTPQHGQMVKIALESGKEAPGRGLIVLSLCEVVKASSGWQDHGSIVTVQDEDLISTRLLFVYPNGFPQLYQVPIASMKIPVGIFDDE